VSGASAYAVEEAVRPDFADAVEVTEVAADRYTVYGRDPGVFYYRVRALADGRRGPASAGVGVRIAAGPSYALLEGPLDASPLLAVQRALLRMCSARGDLLAVLSLPASFRDDQAIAHAGLLRAPFAPVTAGVPPIGYGEQDALTYGALYHPWTLAADEGRPEVLRLTPPDGAACGVIARRAIERGAWIAPANEPWRGLVALAPRLAEERRLDLQDARVNLVRQEPHGFLALAEDTLSLDPDLSEIHVRRLLILLKRAALQFGSQHVFEPNDPSLHRLVQRTFDALLGSLFARGAFAGATPESSFQVATGAVLNTPQEMDAGRFFVELRVAPATALHFLTVRLIQGGERGVVAEVR
jgi:phage tail sheath protein FI